jgi:hypothetical protein
MTSVQGFRGSRGIPPREVLLYQFNVKLRRMVEVVGSGPFNHS